MLTDEKGGVISKVFIIPAGVVAIIAVFLTGYYVGKRQGAKSALAERPQPLPEVLSQYLPEKDDFTFYKTLVEKGEKTVSVDLKPGTAQPERKEGPADTGAGKSVPPRSETPREPDRPAKKDATPTSKVRYTIQVGSYEERGMAEDEVRSMKQKGYAAFVVASAIPGKGTWYRVRVGSFANRQSAEKLANELKTKTGATSFITLE